MNNRVGVDKAVEVNFNITRLQRLCEHFRKRKLLWIIFLIILIIPIIAISTTVALMNKTKREKTSTMEITTPTSTSTTTMEITKSTSIITTTTTTSPLSTTTATSEQLILSVMSDNNTKWKQNASTIAERSEWDGHFDSLFSPFGIHVDADDLSIYIADTYKSRIVRWEFGAKNGEIVAGEKGPGSELDHLHYPTDVVLDKEKKSLIICDKGNQRVMKWPVKNSQNQQVLIPDIVCWGLAMDNNGDLYISKPEKHQIIRWQEGNKEGTIVAGGKEVGKQLNQLYHPMYIFVDEYHSVYVADSTNNRVMKWMKNATEGIRVAPGLIDDRNPNILRDPIGVIVDRMGNIYVSTSKSHQIMRWSPGAAKGVPVVGEKISGCEPTQLAFPHDLSFDRQGNLYVVDRYNGRIQKFAIDLD
ncbi:unnamed protein product [Adineta steineri]|uniref:Uncharacterized protein n=1 Tax=Adineta steineri TaxID=433720 RepID=A0A816DLD8_9BILA|nr:unnamed protein product [Adineta steineri]CAF1638019.1 unnamed protein product [Adineta steineri]